MLQRITITLSKPEQAALERLAQADMRPPREQLRYLLRREAQARNCWHDAEMPAPLPAAASTPSAADRRRAVGP
jgi:hypothetical protein